MGFDFNPKICYIINVMKILLMLMLLVGLTSCATMLALTPHIINAGLELHKHYANQQNPTPSPRGYGK